MPYFPIVKAIAPKAPSGAARMTIATMPKKTCAALSITDRTGLPRSPAMWSAKANSIEMNSTWRISPSEKAPTTVAGMMWSR